MTTETKPINWIKYHKKHAEFTRKKAPPFEEFERLILGMDQEIESGPTWRGDTYNQGVRWFGEDKVHQLFGERSTWKTWQNNGSVCSRIEPSRRRENYPEVTYSHLAEVAYLKPIPEYKHHPALKDKNAAGIQDYYLQLVIDEMLTVSQLRAEIKIDKGEDPKGSLSDRIEKLRKKLDEIIEDLPDGWDDECGFLLEAEKHIVNALNSVNNRAIGQPAKITPEERTEALEMELS